MMPQYDISGFVENAGSVSKSFSAGEVWVIVSVLLAVIGGILLYTTYLGKDKEDKYTGIKKLIYDFVNFKKTIIVEVFRVLYLIITIALTLSSFALITTNFFYFIAVLVFGNLGVRLIFELLLLTLRLFKDVSEINSKMVSKNNNTDKPILIKNKKKNNDTEIKEELI